MTDQYSDSNLDVDADRWYYTKFSVERYRQEVDWEDLKETFDRTAEAIKILLNEYRSGNVFGDEELTALKSIVQVSHVIGVEATQNRIWESSGDEESLEKVSELVASGTGIVGGTAYSASVGDEPVDTVLDIFSTLLDESAGPEEVDEAAEALLELDFENVSGGTLTPLLCLLRPTRFPIINQQSEKVFESCFDIQLTAAPGGYLESAEQFRTVREEFGFDSHLRQLDYFCYWLREENGVNDSPLPDGFGSRDVWQINAGGSTWGEPEFLWPIWQELGICTIGWDTGPLDELSTAEIEEKAEEWDGEEVKDYLRRFGKDIEPGELVIAKDGSNLLGIGVTKRGGYHYCGDYINEQIDDKNIPHPHAWPVEWQVIPDSDIDLDVGNWNLETSLLARKTLVRTGAFEGIRWQLAQRDPSLIPPLAELEHLVADPPTASLPEEFRSKREGGYFILQTGSDEWEDEPAEQYHFTMGIPGSRALWESENSRVVYLEDGELYATARITDIDREERDDEVHLFADIEGYEEIDPIEINEIRGEFETSISLQHPIIEVSENDYQIIIDKGESTRYFWINSATEDWYHKGGETFYTTTTASGSPRRNQSVYERARPGDEVLVYRNAPTQAVVGRASIKAGLHEEQVESREEPAEGITIAWEESLDGVTWSQIKSAPEFEDSPLIESDNSYVVTELSEEQFETILQLTGDREPNYFWATANPTIWDIESTEEGSEVFYTAYNEQGRKRNIFSAFEKARSGDKVLFYKSSPVKQIVGEGTVVEGMHQEQHERRDESVEGITVRYENQLKPVEWETLTSMSELEGTMVLQNNARGSLFTLPEAAYQAIRTIAVDDGPGHLIQQRIAELRTRLSPPDISIELPEGLYFESEDDLRRQIEASLNSGKHIIFTGPPGTGKTKLAKHISEHVTTEHPDFVDDYKFTTATAEWTTFDTIGGYVPNRQAEGDELVFQPRMFLDCFRQEGSVRNEWLVIDEINRSDIDKAFGQLFSVLSGDSVELPYERESSIEIVPLDESFEEDEGTSGPSDKDSLETIITNQDIFPVTPSWRLLATMNTYDKTSLYELSYAFMRRFNFIHVGVPPLVEDGDVRTTLLDPDGDENYATEWVRDEGSLREPLEQTYEQLAVVWYKVNKHQTIGPSIVRDILGYLAASGLSTLDDPGPALTDAVIALVFPQLEGMAPQEQWSLIDSLTDTGVETETGPVDLELDGDRLERKAKDFFDLPPRNDE